MKKFYWVIVRERELKKKFSPEVLFKRQIEMASAEIGLVTWASIAAFQFKNAEAFKEAFGEHCWITTSPAMDDVDRESNIREADKHGFDIDSTTSGWAPWWELALANCPCWE